MQKNFRKECKRQKKMKNIFILFSLAIIVTCVYSTPIYPTNIALGKSTSCSGYYNSGSEVFPYDNIIDGSTADGGQPYDWNFWLTPNGSTGWVMVDLGQTYNIGKIEFLNTHNREHNDRTTKDWHIEIIDALNNVMFTTQGTEADLNPSNPSQAIPVNSIDLQNAISGRYVKFYVDSFWGNGGGLNELRVYESSSAIPEPTTFFLFCIGIISLIARKK